MRRSRATLLAWILLLVPTLVVGALALRSVSLEQQRLERQDEQLARERLQGVAANFNLAIAEMREGLLETLAGIRPEQRLEQLEHWRLENPLIRNVFVWQSGMGLVFPDPERPASDEEKDFVQRYAALFTERLSWDQPLQDPPAASPEATGYLSARSELRELSKSAPQRGAAPEPLNTLRRGWRPWFWENRLYLLGWVSEDDGRTRFGLEVEMMALLSRLLEGLPAQGEGGGVYALLDDRGEVFSQGVGEEVAAEDFSRLEVPVGKELPHWQVALYLPPAGSVAGGSVLLFGSLLVGGFVAAILFGGGLMLWEARRHARDALRKTSFVANVSHELKTPLTTIRMYTELLQEQLPESERCRHYTGVIEGECQRLTRLVNNVLDFGRLEQGQRDYRRERFDAREVISGVLERQQRRLDEAQMALELRLSETPLTVAWDRDALEQILLNLLDNALKYARDGGYLGIQASSGEQGVLIRVCDHGPGVPEAHREKVFDKFHRVDDSLTTRHPGSGLGLSIARQLMRAQGGELRYVPQLRGGCFELTIPAHGGLP